MECGSGLAINVTYKFFTCKTWLFSSWHEAGRQQQSMAWRKWVTGKGENTSLNLGNSEEKLLPTLGPR